MRAFAERGSMKATTTRGLRNSCVTTRCARASSEFDFPLVAEGIVERDIVGVFLPQARRIRARRGECVRDRRQRFVLHLDQFKGSARLRNRFGNHHRNRFAGETHAISCKRP